MPRRRTNFIKRKQNSTKRRPRVQSTTGERNPLRSLIVTGVRTLVSSLPLSTVLLPIVDMVFSAIGFSNATPTFDAAKGLYTLKEVQVYGLSSIIFPTYVNILARTPQAARNVSKGPRIWVDTPFNDAKLVHFKALALPDNQRSKRSGKWSMAFIPFRNVNDLREIAANYQPLDQRQVQSLPNSVTSNADRPLKLNFRPKPEDGYVYQYNRCDQPFGALVIAYSEEVRATYSMFTAEDFAPNVQFSGSLRLRQPVLRGGVIGFEDVPVTLKDVPYIRVQLGKEHNFPKVKDKWNFTAAVTNYTADITDTKQIKSIVCSPYTPALGLPASTIPEILTLDDLAI